MKSVSSAGGKLFATYTIDVADLVFMTDLDGNNREEINLPGLGSVSGFGGKSYDTEVYFQFTSYLHPPTIYRYDIQNSKSEIYLVNDAKIDPEKYEVKRVFYNSKDGTKVPMFLTYKKGIELNGQNPVLLFGYGGFNVAMRPGFSVTNRIFWDNGGCR